MDVLHAAEDLVDQELDVVVRQLLSLDNVVQVGPHQRADQVHVSEVVQRRAGGEHVQKVDDLKIENKNIVGIKYRRIGSQLDVRPRGEYQSSDVSTVP